MYVFVEYIYILGGEEGIKESRKVKEGNLTGASDVWMLLPSSFNIGNDRFRNFKQVRGKTEQ